MTGNNPDVSRFRAAGQVVEILECGGARLLAVLLDSGTVIDVPLECACDLRLGDRVTVEGRLEVNGLSAGVPAGAHGGAPTFTRCWRHEP